MTDHADGDTNDQEPIWEWRNVMNVCVCCGRVREGTVGATLDHWLRCAGVVAYDRMTACGVDPHVAAVVARQLHRELLPVGALAYRGWYAGEPVKLHPTILLQQLVSSIRDNGKDVDRAFRMVTEGAEKAPHLPPALHARATQGRTIRMKEPTE